MRPSSLRLHGRRPTCVAHPEERDPPSQPSLPCQAHEAARPRQGGRRRSMIMALPLLGGTVVLAALGLIVGPVIVAKEIRDFRLLLAPLIAALVLAYYLVQGVRWYPLLRSAGVRLRVRDCLVLNLAGQATSLL